MISIVMPTHYRPVLLELTLASVFSQEYTDYELIVVDASEDKYFRNELDVLLEERLLKFSDKKDKVKIVYPECRTKPGSVKMTGFRNAVQDNDMIIFLDHDDILGENILKYIPLAMRQYPDTEMITTDYITLFYANSFWTNPISYMGGEIYKKGEKCIKIGDLYFNFPTQLDVYKSTHPYKAAIHPQIISKKVLREHRFTFIEDTDCSDDRIWGVATHAIKETRIPLTGYIYMTYKKGQNSTKGRVPSATVKKYSEICEKYTELLDEIGFQKPRNELVL